MSTDPLFFINCDGRFELRAQLDDIGRVRLRTTTFKLTLVEPVADEKPATECRIGVFINGIVADSGSGDSWKIYGFITDEERAKAPRWVRNFFAGSIGSFHGLVNTRNRGGWILVGNPWTS